MANVRLTNEQLEELKEMVIQGVYPDDIASHFGIAVSTVHNHKKKMKQEGVEFPSVKGKRPASSLKPDEVLTALKNDEPIRKVDGNPMKFVVNGITVEIGAGAKEINIDKDHMEIIF